MKLVSALLLFSMSAQSQAAPILKALQRYQADGSLISQPVITQGPNGEKLTVAIEQSSPDDRLTARNESGVKVADIAVYKTTRTERVSVLSAHVNVKGELVAITELSVEGIAGGSRLYADNMKTGFSHDLTQVTQYPQLVAQTQFKGKDLLAIEIDLGQGENGERPSLLRIVDEANGQVLKDIYTSSVIEGRFVVNSQGRLQLITGYNLFDLIDVETGVKTELLPARTKPQAAPHFVQTLIGEMIQVSDHGATNFYDVKSFADGQAKVLRHYSAPEVTLSEDGRQLIEATKTKIRIRDLVTNQPIGQAVPRSPQVGSGPNVRENLGSVQDLLINGQNKIIVISQAELPMSYMVGSLLTYIDLETGKVLRMRRQKLYQVNAQIMQDEAGRVRAIERNWYGQDIDTLVVDLRANAISQTIKSDHRQLFLQTKKGRIVFGHQDEGSGKLCLAYISNLADESCISDPLVTENAIYGVTVAQGEIVIPLDRNLGKQTFSVK